MWGGQALATQLYIVKLINFEEVHEYLKEALSTLRMPHLMLKSNSSFTHGSVFTAAVEKAV